MKLLRFFLFVLLTANPAWAWWHEGHQLVTLIAKDHLTESCQTKISELLEHHPDPDVKTLEQAATWPDLIKEEDHAFHVYDRPDWHYADQPIPDPDAGTHHGHLIKQINRQGQILGDPREPKEIRALALCWYVHLVGDIHQPLHNVSYYSDDFPEGDRGGNRFFVILGQRPIALHILWDSVGARFAETPPPGRLSSYSRSFQKTWPREKLSEAVSVEDPFAWSQKGVRLARELIYPKVRPQEQITNSALQETLDLSKKQICLAGYRLAHGLNERL